MLTTKDIIRSRTEEIRTSFKNVEENANYKKLQKYFHAKNRFSFKITRISYLFVGMDLLCLSGQNGFAVVLVW
jgi:hypothetical protein